MPRGDAGGPPLLGRAEPRLWTPPARRLTPKTTRGFEAIQFAEDVVGMRLHPWQKWLLEHALELRPDGSFRFRTVLVLVARQNGKSTLVQLLALWRMFVDRAPLIIGTAQNLDLAEESWQGAVDIAEGTPELAGEVQHVDRTNGKKQLRLVSGERYKVAAASRRGGRGLSGDLVVLDELREHQTWQAWGAVTKTTMARQAAQIWGLSNAGDHESVVLDALRTRAVAALEGNASEEDDGSLALFEWSAPDGCALTDRAAWAQANPSLGHPNGISEQAVRGALTTDPEAVFRTEVLCQWVLDLSPKWAAVTEAGWRASTDPDSTIADDARVWLALEVAHDRETAVIAAAGPTADGRGHIEVTGDLDAGEWVLDHRTGTDWCVPRLRQIADRLGPRLAGVVIDAKGPAGDLIADATRAGLRVTEPGPRDMCTAYAGIADGVRAEHDRVRHRGQEALNAAARAATTRPLGDRRTWDRRGPVAPVVAASLALWAHTNQRKGTGPCFAFA